MNKITVEYWDKITFCTSQGSVDCGVATFCEMSKFVLFLCQVSSGCCIPKIIKSVHFYEVIQIIKGDVFWDTWYITKYGDDLTFEICQLFLQRFWHAFISWQNGATSAVTWGSNQYTALTERGKNNEMTVKKTCPSYGGGLQKGIMTQITQGAYKQQLLNTYTWELSADSAVTSSSHDKVPFSPSASNTSS